MIRLVSADEVKSIICKYEHGAVQHTMILEIEKLTGCIATDDQMLEILGNADVSFEDNCCLEKEG